MKVGVLYSGGKDSNYAAWLAKKEGYEVTCLISIVSENKHSYMFHTPSIEMVKMQAQVMGIPLILVETKGEKEEELKDLEVAIRKAVKKYGVEGIVTGAVESVYQASRVQKICNDLNLECFNPLWQKDQIELLEDLISEGFEVIVVGVFAYPMTKEFLGRKIDSRFVEDIKDLREKFSISPSGEGGEFESFVLGSPMFKRVLEVISYEDSCDGENSCRREVELG